MKIIEGGIYYAKVKAYDSVDNFLASNWTDGIKTDLTRPQSIISIPINSGSNSTIYANTWSGSISGTASDDNSGLKTVQISIKNSAARYWNGSNWVISQTEILLPATLNSDSTWHYDGFIDPPEDTYLITSHATDNALNFEDSYKVTFILDKTIPQVAISLDPILPDGQNDWYKSTPSIILSATDNVATAQIQYQIDSQSGNWTTYSSSLSLSSEGAHVLYYRALDKAGNYSATGIKNIKYDLTGLSQGPQNIGVTQSSSDSPDALIKWTEAKDNIGIDKYEIQWYKEGSQDRSSAKVDSGIREYNIHNLTFGQWAVKIVAFDAVGNAKDNSVGLTVGTNNVGIIQKIFLSPTPTPAANIFSSEVTIISPTPTLTPTPLILGTQSTSLLSLLKQHWWLLTLSVLGSFSLVIILNPTSIHKRNLP